ncbi:MAG: DUF5107 domain-containing protein [Chloroflexota bacterium]|nr:DUF5107 domain-containing protein [Chloroflexota bacterium]
MTPKGRHRRPPGSSSPQTSVRAWSQPVVIPTYLPGPPDRNPMFLEKRVYQGSSGRVYPNAFTERVSDERTDRRWQAIHIENRHLKLMILPEIGGRIHVAQDRSNGYDFVYRQHVIKPALVGLLGPWISGGVEFNWPQHHRPSTFMPVDWAIEAGDDGSRTVWLSEHEPMNRMKGMVGIRLRPESALVELEVRLANRTPFVQTFLWWANIGARVHDRYQAFFPPDVRYVADHARRATSGFPIARGMYYGVDYGSRREADADLTWYRNIPVPTSYMAIGSDEDFFGGYDHAAEAGFVHVADHRISPGKKLWTWGDHEFGHAWNRNLTDDDGPYIELMAGVYTDNQPDFSFLAPYETRVFQHSLWPFQRVGPLERATVEAGVSLRVADGRARVGVCVSRRFEGATIQLAGPAGDLLERTVDLAPERPFIEDLILPARVAGHDLELSVSSSEGRVLVAYRPAPPGKDAPMPVAAAAPPPPQEVATIEELYLTGLHLEQYRHATRAAEPYWREALLRDPLDARANTALGAWHLGRGEFQAAESCFRTAISRLVARNANPLDGTALYQLGLALQFQERLDEADDAFAKATWNQAWQAAAWYRRAQLAGRRGEWAAALSCIEHALEANGTHAAASNLRASVLRRLGRPGEAAAVARARLLVDPLDAWASEELRLAGDDGRDGPTAARQAESPPHPITERSQPFPRPDDAQIRLDVAHDMAAAGLWREAIGVLGQLLGESDSGAAGERIVHQTLGWLHERAGNAAAADRHFRIATRAPGGTTFPSRLEEIAVLHAAERAAPSDGRAAFDLGNLLYDRRRYDAAIAAWERARRRDPGFATVRRNLGIAEFNVRRRPHRARSHYLAAFRADPGDPRLLYELDQLLKRLNEPPARRLTRLEANRQIVEQRDDLVLEQVRILNQLGRPEDALRRLMDRRFHPWEGGEGLVPEQYVRARLALARANLRTGRPDEAVRQLEAARSYPPNLGEGRHMLAPETEVLFELGVALDSAGDRARAEAAWRSTVAGRLDGGPTEDSFFRALAHRCLGDAAAAQDLLRNLLRDARRQARRPAQVDYFATSLPRLLLFDEDLDRRNEIESTYLVGLALLGLGRRRAARAALRSVLTLDVNHQGAIAALQRVADPH